MAVQPEIDDVAHAPSAAMSANCVSLGWPDVIIGHRDDASDRWTRDRPSPEHIRFERRSKDSILHRRAVRLRAKLKQTAAHADCAPARGEEPDGLPSRRSRRKAM